MEIPAPKGAQDGSSLFESFAPLGLGSDATVIHGLTPVSTFLCRSAAGTVHQALSASPKNSGRLRECVRRLRCESQVARRRRGFVHRKFQDNRADRPRPLSTAQVQSVRLIMKGRLSTAARNSGCGVSSRITGFNCGAVSKELGILILTPDL